MGFEELKLRERESLWEDVVRDDEWVEIVGAGGGGREVGQSIVAGDKHGGGGWDECGGGASGDR